MSCLCLAARSCFGGVGGQHVVVSSVQVWCGQGEQCERKNCQCQDFFHLILRVGTKSLCPKRANDGRPDLLAKGITPFAFQVQSGLRHPATQGKKWFWVTAWVFVRKK